MLLLRGDLLLISAMVEMRDRRVQGVELQDAVTLATERLFPSVLDGLEMREEGTIETAMRVGDADTIFQHSPAFRNQERIILVSIMTSAQAAMTSAAMRMMRYLSRGETGQVISIDLGMQREGQDASAQLYYNGFAQKGISVQTADRVIIIDPINATGGSFCKAIGCAKQAGAQENQIFLCSLFATVQGVRAVYEEFPNIALFVVGALEEGMNDHQYLSGDGVFPEYGRGGCGPFGERQKNILAKSTE